MSAFVVGAKLLGIYLLYAGFAWLLMTVAVAQSGWTAILFQLPTSAVAFAFGWLLAFRTELVARLVRASDSGAVLPASDSHQLLRTGVVLIGLYVVLTRIGTAVRDIGFWAQGDGFVGIGGAALRILIDTLPLLLAAVFVLRPDSVVKLIVEKGTLMRASNRSEAEPVDP